MNIIAKMHCEAVVKDENPHWPNEQVRLRAVYSDSPENKTFAAATPSATVELNISNPEAFGAFEEGREYYIKFTPAE